MWLLQPMRDLTQNTLNLELTPPVKYWEACLGTTSPTVSPCWKVKIIWSPTSETSAAVIYSLYFILYFIQPIIYLGPGARSPDLPSVFCLPDYNPVQQPVRRPPLSWSPLWGLWDVARCRWSWDVAGSLIPTLWEMRFSCSPSCSCNFDQALMWLGSDPDMTGTGTGKRSPWREGGRRGWKESVLIWPVNQEKKGIILKVSFLCCCSALWVIKVSCIRFTPAKIAIYNDLTFLF